MAGFLIGLFFVGLIVLCLFITMLILMQRPNANSGMGAALGGGAAEQAFGGETGNVLTRWTTRAIIVFFVVCLGLYLGVIANAEKEETFDLPEISPVGGDGAEATVPEDASGVVPDVEEAPAPGPDAGSPTGAAPVEGGVLDLREGLLGDGNGEEGNAPTADGSEEGDGTDRTLDETAPRANGPEETDVPSEEASRLPGS